MSAEDPVSATPERAADSGLIVKNDIGTSREELMAAIEATIKPFDEGQLVTGKVVKVDKDEVLVDIGFKAEGVIPVRELSIRHDIDPRQMLEVGNDIEALILQMEDAEGRMILSKKRAQYERAWGEIEDKKRSGGVVEGTVIEVVKGGLIVDIGLRGFLPASLVDLRRVRDLQQFVGKKLECKIIELDRNRNNVVLSRRAYLEEEHSVQRREFLENLKVAEVKRGTVSSIVNFGAFVDLGGVDGLVHVSELSWHHVDHPSEVVKVGDEIDVEILHVDLERDRVSLSLKSTQEDPWRAFARQHQPGDVVKGKISRLVPFGAFVELSDGVEGLIHISELSDEHVELPEQVVSAEEEVAVKLVDVDLERRRISLSLKRAAEPSYTIGAGAPTEEREIVPEPGLEPETPQAREAPASEVTAPDEAQVAEAEVQPPALEPEIAPEPPVESEATAEHEVASAAEPPVEPEAAEPETAEPETAEPEPESAGEPEAAAGPAEEGEEPVAREPELEGELLDAADKASEESLEAIVEEMKRGRE
jgi:small subunit ribosomal protein S1